MLFLTNCEFYSVTDLALGCVGIIFVATIMLRMLLRCVINFRLFLYNRFRSPNLNQYGRWAVVTGGTDGIGKSYACQLAQRGINIILISRNAERLLSKSQELKEKYRVDVDIVQANFTEGWKLYNYIREKLNDREIGILVNNVGIIDELGCMFVGCKEESLLKMIDVNLVSALIMFSAVLPEMVKRKRGAIVTISSISAELALPLICCYGATKAATKSLTNSLYYEYLSSGIVFQTLIPGFVETKLAAQIDERYKIRALMPDPDAYCRSAVVTLGYSRITTGYFLHNLLYLVTFIPDSVKQFVINYRLSKEEFRHNS